MFLSLLASFPCWFLAASKHSWHLVLSTRGFHHCLTTQQDGPGAPQSQAQQDGDVGIEALAVIRTSSEGTAAGAVTLYDEVSQK